MPRHRKRNKRYGHKGWAVYRLKGFIANTNEMMAGMRATQEGIDLHWKLGTLKRQVNNVLNALHASPEKKLWKK